MMSVVFSIFVSLTWLSFSAAKAIASSAKSAASDVLRCITPSASILPFSSSCANSDKASDKSEACT